MDQMAYDRMDFKESMRVFDADGRLHVKRSHISKATVNPYRGGEIPNWRGLGLDPNKKYMLLRDPDELAKGAATFNNLQILIRHIPINAANPEKDLVIGTLGTDAEFISPYLDNSLCFWEKPAIGLIESGEMCELSSAYKYDADMTPGEFNGQHYDGVMRNIRGNHVALVVKGRAGSDVCVMDSDPFFTGKESMKKTQLVRRVTAALDGKLAQDETLGDIVEAVVEAVSTGESTAPVEPTVAAADDDPLGFLAGKLSDEELAKLKAILSGANDNSLPATPPPAADNGSPPAEPAKDEEDDKITQTAMDAAFKKFEQNLSDKYTRLAQAKTDVAPLVGQVIAMDSADEVYKFALNQVGVKTDGVHPSAYPAMLQMYKTQQNQVQIKPVYAQDSATTESMLGVLPNLSKYLGGK